MLSNVRGFFGARTCAFGLGTAGLNLQLNFQPHNTFLSISPVAQRFVPAVFKPNEQVLAMKKAQVDDEIEKKMNVFPREDRTEELTGLQFCVLGCNGLSALFAVLGNPLLLCGPFAPAAAADLTAFSKNRVPPASR